MKQKLIISTAILFLVFGLTELMAQSDLAFTGSQNSLVYQTGSDEGVVFTPDLMAIFKGEPVLSYVEKLKNNGYNVPKESTISMEEQLQAIYGKFKNVPGNSLHVAESQGASKNYDAAKLLAQQGALNSLISNISSKVILVDNQTISKSNETICLDNVVYFELVKSNIENEVWLEKPVKLTT